MGAVRNTRQKQMVYDALTRLDHPTATEVYERVHSEHPTVSRGTVFRVLGGFAAGGQVRRVTLADSDTELGRLMHDLKCADPEKMHYNVLRERTGFFKRK